MCMYSPQNWAIDEKVKRKRNGWIVDKQFKMFTCVQMVLKNTTN